MTTPLCNLAIRYRADKCSAVPCHHAPVGHNYTPTYHSLFSDRRESVKRVLEIGIGIDDGASLRMWADYFPSTEIIGVDINESSFLSSSRIRCYYCDQSQRIDLERIAVEVRPCDLIVDDGSHLLAHQLLSLSVLGWSLAPGGYYVIEDLQPPESGHRRLVEESPQPWPKELMRVGELEDDVLFVMRRPEEK
jgi:8-demethyl-8-alpha-L-rhamnosyltetracenomycin-C 2'-O-methyltransferase